jgi:DNA polymerase-3 subunit alpha
LKFTVNANGNIRFGLGAIKGVGENAVQLIIGERAANGLFTGIFDFVQRVNLNACNKKNMECLALAGGFDGFAEMKREQYFAVNSKNETFLETLIRYGNRYQLDKAATINSLFGGDNVVDMATPEIPSAGRWNDLERLNKEKELIGIYLSAHPLDEYTVILNHVCTTRMVELTDISALTGRELTMGGIVVSVRKGTTKSGSPFCVARIEDYSGSAELAFFGNDYITFQGYLDEGLFLYITARCQPKQWRPGELEIKVTSIDLLSNVKETLIHKITILIPLMTLNDQLIAELSTLAGKSQGKAKLHFKVTDTDQKIQVDLISRSVKVTVGKELIDYIQSYDGLDFRIN